MSDDLFGAGLLLLFFGGVVGLTEWRVRRVGLAPELSRKAVHIGGGLGCLLFPVLVERSATVWALAGLFALALHQGEQRQWLQCLSRVGRRSRGSLYYPFAIALLFWLTADRYGLYLSAVLVLTLSDAAAALVGGRYGRVRYRVGGVDEHKSLEGSLLFWILSFLAVFLPLTLSGETGAGQAALAAYLTASLLTGAEAVSTRGRDNLVLSLLAAFLLLKVVSKTPFELGVQSACLTLLLGLVVLVNRFVHMLRARELTAMSIVVFGVWSLGSADWAVPLLVAFFCFALVFRLSGMEQRRTLVYRRMTRVAAPAAALTLIANLVGAFSFLYGPFLAALLTPAMWGVAVQLHNPRARPRRARYAARVAAAAGTGVLILGWPLLTQGRTQTTAALWTLLGCGLLVALGLRIAANWRRVQREIAVLACTAIAVATVATAQEHGRLAVWQPKLWSDVFNREADVLFPALHP